MIILYSKNNCVACKQTKKQLKNKNIEYTEINVDLDTESRNLIITEGWVTMPVVITETTSWSGYQPDKINSI